MSAELTSAATTCNMIPHRWLAFSDLSLSLFFVRGGRGCGLRRINACREQHLLTKRLPRAVLRAQVGWVVAGGEPADELVVALDEARHDGEPARVRVDVAQQHLALQPQLRFPEVWKINVQSSGDESRQCPVQ